jgi:hypothetical protein
VRARRPRSGRGQQTSERQAGRSRERTSAARSERRVRGGWLAHRDEQQTPARRQRAVRGQRHQQLAPRLPGAAAAGHGRGRARALERGHLHPPPACTCTCTGATTVSAPCALRPGHGEMSSCAPTPGRVSKRAHQPQVWAWTHIQRVHHGAVSLQAQQVPHLIQGSIRLLSCGVLQHVPVRLVPDLALAPWRHGRGDSPAPGWRHWDPAPGWRHWDPAPGWRHWDGGRHRKACTANTG